MKTIKIVLKNQGGAISNEMWNQLVKIDNGELHETNSEYNIILTSGKKITVDKSKVYKNDEVRIIYWGSMSEIGGTEFLFSNMKGHGDGMFEILHGYFAFNIGPLAGFHMLCSVD
jgi:hypothetical protein